MLGKLVTDVVCIGQRLVDGIDDAVDELDDARRFVRLDLDALVFLCAFPLMIVFVAPVIEFREAVKVWPFALCTLPNAQQTTASHRDIMRPDRHGRRLNPVPIVVAFLVIVQGKFVNRNAHGEKMVGDEQVQDVVNILVAAVLHCIGVEALLVHPVHHVLNSNVPAVLAQFRLPEFVCFREKSEAVLAVFRCFYLE